MSKFKSTKFLVLILLFMVKLCNAEPMVFAYWNGTNGNPDVFQDVPDMPFNGGVILAFAYINDSNYSLDFKGCGDCANPQSVHYSQWHNWATKYMDQNARTLISVGGGSTSRDLNKKIREASDDTLAKMANGVAASVCDAGFQGIDLDIEDFWNLTPTENQRFAAQLAKFVIYLRSALDRDSQPNAKTIGVTVAYEQQNNWVPFFKNNEAMKSTDHFNLMFYNMGNASLYLPQNRNIVYRGIDNFINAGLPANKIIFGIQPNEEQLNEDNITSAQDIQSLIQDLYHKYPTIEGAFLWAIGVVHLKPGTLPTPLYNPGDYIQAMKAGFGVN